MKRVGCFALVLCSVLWFRNRVLAQEITPHSSATKASTRTKVVRLGTGAPIADPDRSSPATALVVDDRAYLSEFGPGVVQDDTTLKARIESSPKLPFREDRLPINPPNAGWKLGAISGVATDGKGTIYVIQRGDQADPILALDLQGDLLRSWGSGDFTLPHSLRVDPDGNVWAVDAGKSVVIKYSPAGKKLLTISIGEQPDTGSRFQGATDLAFAPNGDIFIGDGYGNARVLEYTAAGKRIRQWGRPGTGPGEFHLPHAIQIDPKGTVYVADRENGRIEKFDLQGKFLGEIDHLGRCYSLKLANGAIWASMGPLEEDAGAPGWLVKLDPGNGAILGHLDVPHQRQGHAIDVLSSGEPIVTTGTAVLWFRSK